MQLLIQSDVISHTSLVFHFVPWLPMEFNREVWRTAHLFNSFWSLRKQLWQTYVSICSISKLYKMLWLKHLFATFFKIHLTSLRLGIQYFTICFYCVLLYFPSSRINLLGLGASLSRIRTYAHDSNIYKEFFSYCLAVGYVVAMVVYRGMQYQDW